MPYLFVRALVAVGCMWLGGSWALPPMPADTLVLGESAPIFQAGPNLTTWMERGADATVTDASANPQRFETVPALYRHPLTNDSTLWVRLRLAHAPGAASAWTLNIPLPFVDSVTLYQPDGSGGWTAQIAGDTVPQTEWSHRGLYPEFDLRIPSGPPREVFLRVRNFKHLSMPIRLATTAERDMQRLTEWMALGLILGALLTLAALSLLRYAEHRNRADILAAVFGVLILATVAQINGVLNALVWTHLPQWADYANSVMPVVAVGCSLLFMRNLYTLSTHYPRYDRLLDSTAWAAITSVLSYAVLDRVTADWVGAIVLLFVTLVGLATTLLIWRGGSLIWRWLMLAYVPQLLGLLYMVAEAAGLVPTLWEMRYLTSLGVALSVPTMAYSLSLLTRDRKGLEDRANALPTQDALTGLLNAEQFQTQVHAAVERAREEREPAAIVLVEVVNHEALRAAHGDAVAEQCLLRAVVKLHRVLRDVDPAGRVDTDCFGLVLEGVNSREVLTERMVRLIGSGLIPLPGLQPEVTLHFHVACVLLSERVSEPDALIEQLEGLLSEMSPRTRRPIRFLEPEMTIPAPLQSHAEMNREAGSQTA